MCCYANEGGSEVDRGSVGGQLCYVTQGHAVPPVLLLLLFAMASITIIVAYISSHLNSVDNCQY